MILETRSRISQKTQYSLSISTQSYWATDRVTDPVYGLY